MKTLNDLGLDAYPFSIVPPTEPTSRWADRKGLKENLDRLVQVWRLNDTSSIDLMWADLGAGKTHALRYIQSLGSVAVPEALSIYVEVPSDAADFRSLYAQTIRAIAETDLVEAVRRYRADRPGNVFLSAPELGGDRDTPQVLWTIAELGSMTHGDIARRWLRAEGLSARSLDDVGLTSAIKTDEQAVRALASVCHIILEGLKPSRLVLMFDEYQRIAEISERKLQRVNDGIASTFNACPRRLSIFLSCSFGEPRHLDYLLSSTVKSRVSSRTHVERLDRADAVAFVNDLIELHAMSGRQPGIFDAPALEWLVERLGDDTGENITPRRVMQVCGSVLDGALLDGAAFPLGRSAVEERYAPPVFTES